MATTKRKSSTRKAAGRTASPKDDAKLLTVYLVTQTSNGQFLKPKERAKEQARVSQAVKEAGATCRLFATATKDGPQQLVSLVSGLSPAGSRKLAKVMEVNGYVSVEILFQILKGGP